MKVARTRRLLQRWERAQARHEEVNGVRHCHLLMLPGYRRLLIRSVKHRTDNIALSWKREFGKDWLKHVVRDEGL